MNTMNLYQKEFTEYANKNEQNLHVAILAGLSFHKLRGILIDEFEAELRGRLEEKGWSRIDDNDLKKRLIWSNEYWAKFRKSHWPERIYVGIEPNKNFSFHNFGVIANKEEVQFDKLKFNRTEISDYLKSILGNGFTNGHCVWANKLGADYANLNSAEGLMALSKFKWETALTDLVGKINAVGDALDSFFSKAAQCHVLIP